MMKTISILGSTGSIGTQSLDIIRENREEYRVKALTLRQQYTASVPADR